MSRKKPKPDPEEPLSDEARAHLEKLAQRKAGQAERSRRFKQVQEAIDAVGNCINFLHESGLWNWEQQTRTDFLRSCEWHNYARRWVDEMLAMAPAVEGVAKVIGVPEEHFFEYRPSRPVPPTEVDPISEMASLVARLRLARAEKAAVEQVKRDLAAILQADSSSLDAYALYFRCVENTLGIVGVRWIEGHRPLVDKAPYDPPHNEHLQLTRDNVLRSIEYLHDIMRFFADTVPSVRPEDLDADALRERVAASREEMRTVLSVLPRAAQRNGIDPVPLAELGTQWELLWKEQGHDKVALARKFSDYLDGKFVTRVLQRTTYPLRLIVSEMAASTDSNMDKGLNLAAEGDEDARLASLLRAAEGRCSGSRLERVQRVLRALAALAKEWVTSRELDDAGISSATVYARCKGWKRGVHYRGASSRVREYLLSAVLSYVANEWTPKLTA